MLPDEYILEENCTSKTALKGYEYTRKKSKNHTHTYTLSYYHHTDTLNPKNPPQNHAILHHISSQSGLHFCKEKCGPNIIAKTRFQEEILPNI